MCDRITLERIASADYVPFIQNKFKKKWGKILSDQVIENILAVTENHPYYVNVLCHKLWFLNELPSEKDVEKIWHQYAYEEKTNITNEIGLLSPNQAKMLIAIAKYSDDGISPMNKEFIALTKFSLSSASQAVKALENKDYLMLTAQGEYKLVDPLIKYIFQQ